MRIKNISMINLINVLSSFSDKRLPQKIGYAITKNLVLLNKEYSVYDSQLKKIIDAYKDNIIKDEDGNQIMKSGIPTVDDSVSNEYYSQINELLNIEVDVDLRYVDESVFDYDNNNMYDVMTAKEIMILQSILVNHEEDKNE